MNELTNAGAGGMVPAESLQRMAEMLGAMADMLRATMQSVEDLRRQVRLLEKVTGAQAGALNREVRERAAELCGLYLCEGREQRAAAAIRKAVKLQFGAAAMKDLPRCEYPVAMDFIRGWDDYRAMRRIGEESA